MEKMKCRVCTKKIDSYHNTLKYGKGICDECFVLCPPHISKEQYDRYNILREKKLEKLIKERHEGSKI